MEKGGKKLQPRRLQKENEQTAAKSQGQENTAVKGAKEICTVCHVYCGSKRLREHCSTELHKDLVEAKQHWLWEGKSFKTLDEQIEKQGSDIPIVGLQYIRQYEPDEDDETQEYIYECQLCQSPNKPGRTYRPRSIFYHVLSVQHRIFYLARHHKAMGIDRKYEVTSREKYHNLVTCTTKAAQLDGWTPIKVLGNSLQPKITLRDYFQKTMATSTSLVRLESLRESTTHMVKQKRPTTDSNNTEGESSKVRKSCGPATEQEDLLELLSEFLESQSKSQDQEEQVEKTEKSFQELKAAHEARRGQMWKSKDYISGRGAKEDYDPAYFWCNEELFDFLMALRCRDMEKTGSSRPFKYPGTSQQIPRFLCSANCEDMMYHSLAGKLFATKEYIEGLLLENCGHINKPGTNRKPEGDLTVERKEDVAYVMKVANIFASALVRHKNRTEEIKRKIAQEKIILEIEKKKFLSKPGVSEALQKKTKEKEQPKSPPPSSSATKRKAPTEVSSSSKPLFPSATTTNSEPSAKVQNLMSLKFESYRPTDKAARNPTPPRRRSDSRDSRDKPAQTSPRAARKKSRSQERAAAKTSPRRRPDSSPKFRRSRSPTNQRPAYGQTSNRPKEAANNPSLQRMASSQNSQSGPSSDQRPAFGQSSNRPSGRFMESAAGNPNSSQQQMSGSQFGQSDQRLEYGQNSNRPQGLFSEPSAAYTDTSQPRKSDSQFAPTRPSFDSRPSSMEKSDRPHGRYTGPSQQQMSGSQYSQSESPSDLRPAFGQSLNRSQGPTTVNANRPQPLSGQFSLSRPTPGSRPSYGPKGSESDFQQSQTSSAPRGDGFGMISSFTESRQTFSEPRPSMYEEKSASFQPRSAFGEQKPPSEWFRSELDETRLPLRDQRQPLDQSWPSAMHSRNPANEDFKRPLNTLRPSVNEREQIRDSGPAFNMSRPPINTQERGMELKSGVEPIGSRPSWQDRRPEQGFIESSPSWQERRPEPGFNESKPSWEERTPEQGFNESRPSWQQKRPEQTFNESRPSWQEPGRPGDQYSILNKPRSHMAEQGAPLNETRNQPRPLFNEQRLPSTEPRPLFNEQRPTNPPKPILKEMRPLSNPARPSYSMSDRYTEPDALHKDESYTSSQYGNTGYSNERRTSYGAGQPQESGAFYKGDETFTGSQMTNRGSAGATRPLSGLEGGRKEPNDYYKENEKLAQYGNTGPTGGARPSYGAGRSGESDSYYKAIERFSSSQFGNSGSIGGARQHFGPGAGDPEESGSNYKGNAKFTGSLYGNPGSSGGMKPSGPGVGGPAGSMGNFSSDYVQYPLKSSSSFSFGSAKGSQDPQSSQRPSSIGGGTPYGMNQGKWSNSLLPRSDTFPSRAPGANTSVLSNQGNTFKESWK